MNIQTTQKKRTKVKNAIDGKTEQAMTRLEVLLAREVDRLCYLNSNRKTELQIAKERYMKEREDERRNVANNR
jgi:hypothetical protein